MMRLTDNPLVSVIIPVYNRADILAQTLASVVAQSWQHWECILVDDDSQEDTRKAAEPFLADKRFSFYRREGTRPHGANSCRNQGLALSTGGLIKWLDSDDLIDPTCLEKQVKVLRATEMDVVFCQTDYFEHANDDGTPREIAGNRKWGRPTPKPGHSYLDEYLLGSLRWQTAAGLWRREFVGEKPFLEGLNNSQEWLMHLRMLLREPKIAVLEDSLVHARIHTGSMSSGGNKRGVYYLHQCISRMEALRLLEAHGRLARRYVRKLMRFISWNHLFIFYKGAPLKGLAFLSVYPKLLGFLIRSES